MARKPPRRSSKVPLPIWILGGVLIGLLVYRGTVGAASVPHPDPRPGVTAAAVVDAARYEDYPHVAEVYALAARVPAVLDGLYCHCDCARHSGHRSLLTCFETDHGAGCDVCLEEARIAYEMSLQQASLSEIRKAVDDAFTGP